MHDNLLETVILDAGKKTREEFQKIYNGLCLIGEVLAKRNSDQCPQDFLTDNIETDELEYWIAKARGGLESSTSKLESSHKNTKFIFKIEKKLGSIYMDWITIGRAKNNDIVIRCCTVSKLHARLIIEKTDYKEYIKYLLVDSKSTGGTMLNGQLLHPSESIRINPYDKIQFGRTICHVLDADGLYDRYKIQGVKEATDQTLTLVT